MNLLQDVRVVSMALNLPGPVACARLREFGASVRKIEPPSGDPFERYCPAWYGRLHDGVEVRRVDLKSDEGRRQLDGILATADLLVTAQRPGALERLALAPTLLAERFPELCHVAITGHAPPDDDIAGHDLTYLATQGLVQPPAMPATLFADMAGSERAVSTALAMLLARARDGRGRSIAAPLEEAARALAGPLHEGLTTAGALLGGGDAGYNLYAASEGWIAVAALEPHFANRLAQALGLPELSIVSLKQAFATRSAIEWQHWARERDLPVSAVRVPPTRKTS